MDKELHLVFFKTFSIIFVFIALQPPPPPSRPFHTLNQINVSVKTQNHALLVTKIFNFAATLHISASN
jgi:hypothetical protein